MTAHLSTRVPAWPSREQVVEAEQAFLLAGDCLMAHAEAFHGGVALTSCRECQRLEGYEARTADRYGALFMAEAGAWLVA